MAGGEVLVVPREHLSMAAEWRTGFIPQVEPEMIALVHEHLEFVPRDTAETDEGLKQLIPYVVIAQPATKRYFVYQRLAGSGEERLKNLYSLGIGGHIDRQDVRLDPESSKAAVVRGLDLSSLDQLLSAANVTPLDSPLRRGLTREIAEEVVLPAASSIRAVGLINDDSNAVGRVHLGLVFVLEIGAGEVRMREKVGGELQGGLYTREQMLQLPGEMETWSQLLVDWGLSRL